MTEDWQIACCMREFVILSLEKKGEFHGKHKDPFKKTMRLTKSQKVRDMDLTALKHSINKDRGTRATKEQIR